MEVLHRPGLMYAPQPPGLYQQPTMPRVYTSKSDMYAPKSDMYASRSDMYASRSDMYACYSLHVTTPSRTPSSDHPNFAYHNHNALDTTGHTTTLQSVLRGNMPHSYSHLSSSSPVSYQNTASNSFYISPASSHNPPIEINHVYPALSPCPSFHSTSSYSPRPSSNESHTSQDSTADLQTEPMDLSYKKTFGKRKAASAFLDATLSNSQTSNPSSSRLKLPRSSSSSEFSPSTTNSTCTSSFMHTSPQCPADGEEFSLLRNLLSVGKHRTTSTRKLNPSHQNTNSDTNCDLHQSDSSLKTNLTAHSQVQLAKKNLFPVSARVSDWLVKIVQFARSIPEFSGLSHNDKITLILNSWTRIMLLYMAESNFQFAVTPVPSSDAPVGGNVHFQKEPTMKAVEGMQTFIKKCQKMSVDGKEYEFFRMLVLFNSGYPGLSSPELIDQLSSVVQQLLQQHVRVTRPRNLMHYSRLLMCLPCLYSINGRMFESLFCKHITKTTDMEVLLKELLQNIP